MTSCPSFSNEKNCQAEHYFPANILCHVMKRQLSTALGLVSRLFHSCSLYSNNYDDDDDHDYDDVTDWLPV